MIYLPSFVQKLCCLILIWYCTLFLIEVFKQNAIDFQNIMKDWVKYTIHQVLIKIFTLLQFQIAQFRERYFFLIKMFLANKSQCHYLVTIYSTAIIFWKKKSSSQEKLISIKYTDHKQTIYMKYRIVIDH